MFKFGFILWVYDNFSFPHKVHFADRSLPVPQCSKPETLLYWSAPFFFFSFLFLISDSGRIRNDGFPNKTMAGKGDSFLWDSQKNAGQCGGTICFLPSALELGGHMLKKSWVLLGGPQPGIPLSPECFGSWLLKVWPLDQPRHHYRGTCQKCRILGLPSASESESAFEPDPKWF